MRRTQQSSIEALEKAIEQQKNMRDFDFVNDLKMLLNVYPKTSKRDYLASVSYTHLELDFLFGIAKGRWGVRGAKTVYNNSVRNENITYGGLYNMAVHLGVGWN